MAEQLLGPRFEIHGGGLDLVFPHHENEIAQSNALGHDFAEIWMHNGMLEFVGEKMAKSVGNVTTIRDALDEWGRETLLLFFMTGALAQADRLLARRCWRLRARRSTDCARCSATRRRAPRRANGTDSSRRSTTTSTRPTRSPSSTRGATTICCGALSTSSGSASLAEASRRAGARRSSRSGACAARAARDFAEADRLRAEIDAAGWVVRDVAGGFQLFPKR